MAFTEVAWANNDVVTETKMDQMVATDVHVREEANYVPVVTTTLFNDLHNQEATTPTPALVVDINGIGTTSDASFSGAGWDVEADINISALSTGIHEIDLALTPVIGSASSNFAFKFFKTPDMTYLTVFANLYGYRDSSLTISHVRADVTIIGHREAKAWTA